jgi:hypothetical protein
MIACLDKAEIKALAHPTANGALTYHGIASFLPAPWLLEAVSNTNTKDPALIILAASKFAAEFDNEHKNYYKYVTSAKDQLKEFIKWAWVLFTYYLCMAQRLTKLVTQIRFTSLLRIRLLRYSGASGLT